MAIPFVAPIDLNRNELQNARLQNLASAPAHAAGLIYFDTGTKLLGVSDGTQWTYLAVAGLDTEAVQDVVGAMGQNSSVVTATYNDNAGTIVYTIANGAVTDAMVASGLNADKLVAGSTNGVYTLTEKTKLTGIATGATANSTDAVLENRANHTGTQSADTLTDGSTNRLYTSTEKTKLAGIATGATANSTDAYLLSRTNHTGTQTSSTISDFTSAVNAIVANVVGAAPSSLDTLKELADALGDDPNFAATMTSQLALKANISSLAAVATAGTYASLTGKPNFVATVGDGTATSYTITHSLGTQNVAITLRLSASPYTIVIPQAAATSNTTVTLNFGSAPAAGQYTVYITAI